MASVGEEYRRRMMGEYVDWWSDAAQMVRRARELVGELHRLVEEAGAVASELERLAIEAKPMWETAGELGWAGFHAEAVASLCRAWAELVREFGLVCDPDAMAVCRGFLRPEEVPRDCPTY